MTTSKQTKRIRRTPKEAMISLQVETALKNKLEKVARIRDRSVSFIVRTAIEKYFEGMKQEGAAA